MVLIDPNETFGAIFTSLSTGLTGDMPSAFLGFLIFLVALCLAFGMPLDLLVLLVFPFVMIAVVAVGTPFVIVFGIFLMFIAILIGRVLWIS